MSKKKENIKIVGGVALVAVVVAVLMLSLGGDTSPSADNNTVATTTIEAPAIAAPRVVPPAPAAGAPVDRTAAGVVLGLSNSGNFAALLQATGLDATLRGAGPYTVFVPANSAFALLPSGSVNGLSAAQKKRLVEYHVVSGKLLDLDAVYSGNYTALSKDSLNFLVRQDTGGAYVNSGSVLAQYKASNGVVYVVSTVLFPPQEATRNGNTGSPTPR